jgi:Mannosylglycerate hydrolase MGH1-like glycoside hydrolase domain/Glycosyl hydrolase family 63 C-terminal domain
MKTTAEHRRLAAHRERKANWKKWGPYLSERSWGTIREDYSNDGDAWNFFPHDQARSRAYRWGDDGIAGISDRHQYLCFSLAMWNEKDPILKERFFGLNGFEGNHGEDVKEYYYYLDSTPTHSYMKMLYKYPQAEFPYTELVKENHRRDMLDLEYELADTGVFEKSRYFDIFVEYAKGNPDDILIKITAINRGPKAANCWFLPMLWFRNTWSWGYDAGPMGDVPERPELRQIKGPESVIIIRADHPVIGTYYLFAESSRDVLFTDNETNKTRLFGKPNDNPFVKDAFHRYLINGRINAVNPERKGTKAAVLYHKKISSQNSQIMRLRLSKTLYRSVFEDFDRIFERRMQEAEEFYAAVQNPGIGEDQKNIQRQALAGMLWSKQFFYYNVEQWMSGDPGLAPPLAYRANGRNQGWEHLNNFDIISMPDKWEYPWYAGWDLAFHCISLAIVDADFAKRQLELMAREWYMHPNGQLPAYEWNFSDVNPPVHAWAAWRVYKIDAKQQGKQDIAFLESIFHKLLLNFTWWVNKKDEEGKNVFQGGFLGLDNISVFDRSAPLPTGGHIDQSDGTSWMGFYCLVMLKIAIELANKNPVYENSASKFFEHFLRIARAMAGDYRAGLSLWNEEDSFFYDALHLPDNSVLPLKVRSLVGLIPLLAVETLEHDLVEGLPVFKRRLNWIFKNRIFLRDRGDMACVEHPGDNSRRLLSIVTRDRLVKVLGPMLDENEFLSEYGIRSLSKYHKNHPYTIYVDGQPHTISYQPAESTSGLFGGNSNWRGPVWFPVNYLLIESLQKFHHYYGEGLKVECPTGSGHKMTLGEVATELSLRLVRLFLRNKHGKRPIYGGQRLFQDDPHWRDLLLFYEYFHGENGAGLGAGHQTGWTGLVAKLIQQSCRSEAESRKENL